MTTVIEVNQAQMNEVLSLLGNIEKDAKLALRRSINKTATAAKTLSAKGIGSTVTMKSKKIKEYITIRKATGDKLSATTTLKGALAPAMQFTNRKLSKGVSVKIWKAKSPDKFRHAFYATMPNGHTGIYMREEIALGVISGRLPIRELFGPSITTVYEKTPGLSNQIETESSERLLHEMDSQVNYILSRR